MDRLDELEVFLAICDAGSMAAAAQKLRRSASAVTRILNGLEQRMGTRLFERSTRRLTATADGIRLAEQARKLLMDYELVMQDHQQDIPRGMLRITAPMAFGRRHVAPLVSKFLKQYPEVQIELMLADRNLGLIENGIDLAVRIGSLTDSSLVARPIGEVKRVLVASPSYLQQRGVPTKPSDLQEHELILGTGVRGLAEWRFGEEEDEQIIRFTPRLLLNDVEAMLGAVRDGFGIGRALTYQVAPDLQAGTMVRLLAHCEPQSIPVHLVYQGTKLMATRLRTFIEFAFEDLSLLDVIR